MVLTVSPVVMGDWGCLTFLPVLVSDFLASVNLSQLFRKLGCHTNPAVHFKDEESEA